MTPKDFSNLLERYKKGLASQDEIRQIDDWYRRLNFQAEKPESTSEKEAATLSRILTGQVKKAAKKSRARTYRKIAYLSSIAACLLIGLSLVFRSPPSTILNQPDHLSHAQEHNGPEDATHYANQKDATRMIMLEDGSSVLLKPGSELYVKDGFGTTHRKTLLKGEAFFEVAHNPEVPFIVLCESVVTKVLGTSFWIKSSSDAKSVEVEVHSGKVSVFKKPEKEELHSEVKSVTLTANQKASFSSQLLPKRTELIHSPPETILTPRNNHTFVFTEAPLAKVLETLSETYGLAVSLDLPKTSECSFTGDLSDLTLPEKLEIICFSTATSFEVDDSQIIVTGSGCR